MSSDGSVRVLVVDDDVDFRMLLRVQLNLAPELEVVGVAGDGVEAIEAVKQDPPDAVAMDLLMPRMNGFEAIEHIKGDHPDVGIVAYTAVAGDYARRQTELLGVELVLKSGDQSELVRALLRSVGRNGSSPGQ
ncbi:MAG: response regulator transcription factor [Nitriliruptorales bacterium]|nr:response regulator transcription factor [Nitriliruptorales bacterium]